MPSESSAPLERRKGSPPLQLLYASAAIALGFVFLVWSADRFVEGAAGLARNLGVAPLVIGVTIVGLGTSAPEMLVSLVAALTGSGEISVGNAVGSNITNIGLILGVAAVVNPLVVSPSMVRREVPLLFLIMAISGVMISDGHLGFYDGAILLSGFVLMMIWMVRRGMRGDPEAESILEEVEELPTDMSTAAALAWLVVGMLVLLASSRVLVWGAVEVARFFEVSELVIGLTVVALGTSLPEMAASVVAARKNEHDIAVGNVIGSNMFNLLVVLGLPGVAAPGQVNPMVLSRDFPIMAGLTLLFIVFGLGAAKGNRVGRIQGGGLVVLYGLYVVYLGLGG